MAFLGERVEDQAHATLFSPRFVKDVLEERLFARNRHLFRDMKTVLETRPIYHRLDETIKRHVFCSFLAPALRKELDKRLEHEGKYFEWAAIKQDLKALQETIRKEIRRGLELQLQARKKAREVLHLAEDTYDLQELIETLEREMYEAAERLEFERAAEIRDRIKQLKESPVLADADGKTWVSASTIAATATKSRNRRGRSRKRRR